MSYICIRVNHDTVAELRKRFPRDSIDGSIRRLIGMKPRMKGPVKKYLLEELEVGECKSFECDGPRKNNLVYQAVFRTEKRFKMKFRIDSHGGVARVTRLR